jgi:hypothetical protein
LIYTVAGREHGKHREGKKAIIKVALYDLKSSGACWRDHLASMLRDFGYTSCGADPNIWKKPKTKWNGDRYWEYVLAYDDDILCISHEPSKFTEMLQVKYTLKKGSVREPTEYLGSEVCKHYIENSEDQTKVKWALSSDKYVDRAIKEVDKKLKTRVKTRMSLDYRPELNDTPELDVVFHIYAYL